MAMNIVSENFVMGHENIYIEVPVDFMAHEYPMKTKNKVQTSLKGITIRTCHCVHLVGRYFVFKTQ